MAIFFNLISFVLNLLVWTGGGHPFFLFLSGVSFGLAAVLIVVECE